MGSSLSGWPRIALASLLALAGCAPPPAAGPGDADADTATDADLEPDAARDSSWDVVVTPDADEAGPCGDREQCGELCVDLETDPEHCGRCDRACSSPANGAGRCVEAECTFDCHPGYVREGEGCVVAPRLLWPPSTATVTGPRPAFLWELPEGLSSAELALCADRACSELIESVTVDGTEGSPGSDLPPGVVFWRVTASGRASPVWQVVVPRRDAGRDGAWGVWPDYDGDGLGDVAVGAPFARDGDGRGYVHLADESGVPAAATVILRSPSGDGAAGELGIALACGGDVNGDGFADLLVGEPRAAEGGRAHLYLGGPEGPGETPDQTLEPPSGAPTLFGGALAAAGDVDGDGFGDAVVAALGEGLEPGRAYLFRGGSHGLSESPEVELIGGGRFGTSLAGALDLDGDRFADLAVGAPAAASSAGEVHLFLGSADGIGTEADLVLAGPDGAGARFGAALGGAGDVDGDGLADLAVGAPEADSARGHVFLYLGDEGGPSLVPSQTLVGLSSGGGYFGAAVGSPGDANGDGFDDLAVGSFGVDGRRGRILVYLGGETGLAVPEGTRIEGPFGAEGDFGWALASAGDADGDGLDDLVVGSPGVDDRAGRVYVYRGGAGGLAPTPLGALVAPAGGSFGRALARADR